jgi:hypothetical protein
MAAGRRVAQQERSTLLDPAVNMRMSHAWEAEYL